MYETYLCLEGHKLFSSCLFSLTFSWLKLNFDYFNQFTLLVYILINKIENKIFNNNKF